MCKVEVDIVDDYQVEKSIAVKVDEGATCAPALRRKQTAFFSLIAERAPALVPVQNVLPPLGHEQVGVAVIVDVTGADTLAPAGTRDSRFFGSVFKFQSTQVVIKERPGLRAVVQAATIHQKNVGKAIVVVVDNCHARPGGLDDVLFSVGGPGDFNTREASLRGEIFVAHGGCFHAWRERPCRDRSTAGRHTLSAGNLTVAQNDQGKKSEDCGMNCAS